MSFDIVAFGSATHDIYVTSDEFEVRRTEEGPMMCQLYGHKIDLTQMISTTGGGASNAAVCFERMGLQTALVACIGRDFWGRMVREQLEAEGVSMLYLQAHPSVATSSSVALVGSDGNRTILVYRAASNLLSAKKVDWGRLDGRWAYISSLGGNMELLLRILKWAKNKQAQVAFNPGNGELEHFAKLQNLLEDIDLLILNKQEAAKLWPEKELNRALFTDCGAGLVVITDGVKGADCYSRDGQHLHQAAILTKVVEVTGAGDAYGSGLLAGLANNLPLEKALELAAYNSSSVVEQIGPKKGLLFWPEACKKLRL